MANEQSVIRFHAEKLSAENVTIEIPSSRLGALVEDLATNTGRKLPDSEQLKIIDKKLTVSLQEKLKKDIPEIGDNPLLREIFENLHVGLYNFADEEEVVVGDTRLEQIRQELTVELQKELDSMGLPSKGASVGAFLAAPKTMIGCRNSKTCGPYKCRGFNVYGTCTYWCC